MSILEFFVTKTDQQGQRIGQVECPSENVTTMLSGLLSSMGMINPVSPISTSAKAVVITKKGNTYTLTLNMYQPPIVVSWTGTINVDKLQETIEKLSQDRKKVAAINYITLQNGAKLCQLAIG